MNDSGNLAFTANVSVPSVGNEQGLFFYSDAAGLVEILQYGDAFDGSTITGIKFAGSTVDNSVDTNQTGLDSSNRVVFSFSLANGQSGIAVWNGAAAKVPFATWEAQPGFFNSTQLADPTISGPNAIPQSDRIPNLLKYLYNINPSRPMTSADRAALPVVGFTKGTTSYLTLTYRQYSLLTGITINVQTSPDLRTWTTVTPDLSQQVGTDSVTGDPILQLSVATKSASKLFIRLNVTMP